MGSVAGVVGVAAFVFPFLAILPQFTSFRTVTDICDTCLAQEGCDRLRMYGNTSSLSNSRTRTGGAGRYRCRYPHGFLCSRQSCAWQLPRFPHSAAAGRIPPGKGSPGAAVEGILYIRGDVSCIATNGEVFPC